jgi:DNA polymerase elongation subunit (family B)
MSKTLDEYRDPSPAARAAAQLAKIGKTVKQGQRVRFIYTRGDPGVHAWDLPTPPNPAALDVPRYTTLFIRAASSVLQPLGVDEQTLRNWVIGNAAYLTPPGVQPARASSLPLWQAQPALACAA